MESRRRSSRAISSLAADIFGEISGLEMTGDGEEDKQDRPGVNNRAEIG
jgi:hypothetical protein